MARANSSVNKRVWAVLEGEKPDRIPFISRMDFWHKGLAYQNKIPEKFGGMDLEEIHRSVGIGQEEWMSPHAFKYRNLELILYSEGEVIHQEHEPEIEFFPDLWGIIPVDRAGEITVELRTPAGKLTCLHRVTEDSIRSGTTRPQLVKHPVVESGDFKIYEYIIEHSDFVPRYENFYKRSAALGDSGFLVPTLNRVPFQSLLIDIMGEINCFYGLYDNPGNLERLIDVIDRQITESLQNLSEFKYPYLEFIDNLDGMMTNPRLFRKYTLPSYQKYAGIVHQQGKKLGSHADGDLKNLVEALAGCGLDICESFTPAPMTGCTFEEAFESWNSSPIIWGGIPSYFLEERVHEREFENYIESLLGTVVESPVILGIADAVMTNNLVERVEWISSRIENLII